MSYLLIIALGVVGVIGMGVLRLHMLVVSTVLARAICDVGYAAGHALLPGGMISVALSVFIWLSVLVRLPRSVLSIKSHRAAIGLVFLGSVLIYMYFHGFSVEPIVYTLALSSLVPLYLLARASVADIGSNASLRIIGTVTLIPCGLFVVGSLIFPSLMVGTNGRAAGTFVHANAAGSFLAIAVTVVSWLALSRGSAYVIPLLVAVSALVLTESLNALISALSGIFMLLILLPATILARTFYLFSCAVASWLIVSFTALGSRIHEALSSDFSAAIESGVSQNSFEWRILNWVELIHAWSSSPVFGWGIGSTASLIQPLGGPPHSMYVQVLVETGIIGVAAGLALGISLGSYSIRKQRAYPGSPYMPAVVALFVCLAVNGFASNLLTSGAALYLSACVLGILSGLESFRICGFRVSLVQADSRELSSHGTAGTRAGASFRREVRGGGVV